MIDAASLNARGVRVKALEWDTDIKGRWIGTPPVRLGEMAFWVFLRSEGFVRHGVNGKTAYYPTLEAAKAAAQADYTARILAALEVSDE